MKYSRSGCAAVAFKGFIYVAGGWNEAKDLNVMEKYCIETNQWHEISPMKTTRRGLRLVELKGKFYALGGSNGKRSSNMAECYDPEKDQWEFKTNMNNEHIYFGAVNFQDNIYVVGKKKSEVFKPQINRWEVIPGPKECHASDLVVFEGKLVVIGGLIGKSKDSKGTSTVQYYDSINRIWNNGKDMDVSRCFHSSAVISAHSSQHFNL